MHPLEQCFDSRASEVQRPPLLQLHARPSVLVADELAQPRDHVRLRNMQQTGCS